MKCMLFVMILSEDMVKTDAVEVLIVEIENRETRRLIEGELGYKRKKKVI